MKHIILAVVITTAVVGAGAFYGGMKYGQRFGASEQLAQGQFRFSQSGARQNRSGNFAGGQVLTIDQNSMTVKTPDGGSRIVFINPSVAITKTVGGSLADIKSGDDIMVQGTANADGSISAQSIQIRPLAPSPTK